VRQLAIRRRNVLIGGVVAACASPSAPVAITPAPPPAPPASPPVPPISAPAPTTARHALDDLEAAIGGRVGVFALDTGSGRAIAHRADERFAMCSTFKWALTAAVLARVDRGDLDLATRVPYGQAALMDHSPRTRAELVHGAMSIADLAEAAITVSDNAAANLLLAQVGGPAGLTAFARQCGDSVTRLDRTEMMLNVNTPGDERDTTSPRAMVGLMRAVLLGDVLGIASRDRLRAWLNAAQNGADRLPAGLPADWTVGHKTGTGMRGALNDVAIAVPPGRAPILIASYLSDSSAPLEKLTAAHQAIGQIVAMELS
jgi:beta-lactamase class A